MNKLGLGLMRLPRKAKGDPGSVDVEAVVKMVDLLMDNGCNYFDTAWGYHNFKSENIINEVLARRYPREAFLVATKLHCYYLNKAQDRDYIFYEQLKKTGLAYFDRYLLHDMNAVYYERYKQLDCFEWLMEKKRQGLVKKIGFSFHDGAGLLRQILLEHPEMEFVQLQINWLDWKSEGIQSERCYRVCEEFNKPVIVMEPLKGGLLAALPDKADAELKRIYPNASAASWAIRFAAGLPLVERVLSGMGSVAMVAENIESAENAEPLSNDELDALNKAADVLKSIPRVLCTGCGYCLDSCPVHIPVARFFSLFNDDSTSPERTAMSSNFEYYEALSKAFAPASACIRCGICEDRCTQKLPVRAFLAEVAAHFEQPFVEEPDID